MLKLCNDKFEIEDAIGSVEIGEVHSIFADNNVVIICDHVDMLYQ